MDQPEPKRCLGCGYILDHLPEPRCPECGRGFDLTKPETYFLKRESAADLVVFVVIADVFVAFGVLLVPGGVVLAIMGETIHIFVLVECIRMLRAPAITIRWRRSLFVSLVLAIIGLLPLVGVALLLVDAMVATARGD